MLGLFTGRIEDRPDFAREMRRRLKQQRRLADAGLAASRTSDPGTTPPPSTRSNSSMPVDNRTAFEVSTSAYSFAPAPAPNCAYRLSGLPCVAASVGRSSTSEFHAPHSTQRPIHFGACAPHSWQTNTTILAGRLHASIESFAQ
jgi:hypothetical protein